MPRCVRDALVIVPAPCAAQVDPAVLEAERPRVAVVERCMPATRGHLFAGRPRGRLGRGDFARRLRPVELPRHARGRRRP